MEISLSELNEFMSLGISHVTVNELKQSHSMVLGKNYLIRTVTMFYTGRLLSVTDSDIVLGDAAWIADTGRFYNCLKEGTLSEVEPFVVYLLCL